MKWSSFPRQCWALSGVLVGMGLLCALAASAQTPSDEPSYAGALGFFRHDPTHQPGSADVVGRYEFDITQTVRKLAPTGAALTISVVLAPLTKAGAPSIRVRSAKLIVVESLVRRKS